MSFGVFNRENNNMPMSEINTTPLVDVMLVLLIIFIITAPLITNSINVNLPSSKASSTIEKPDIVKLGLDINGKLFWNGREINKADLAELLNSAVDKNPETEIHLQADRNIRYQKITDLMTEIKKAGIVKLGFISATEK
jgi:biopolymer transport protein ExbD